MTALLGIFNIIPGWIWALITAGALATSCVQTTRVSMVKADHATTRAQFAERVAQAEEAARIQSEKNRAIEQELSHAQAETERETASLRGELDRARAAGNVASVRLRDTVAAVATATLAGCTATASAELRQTAATAARVSADVLAELEQRSRLLGATADDRYLAGRACERQYEAAVKAPSP
jgi:hypothetical protein